MQLFDIALCLLCNLQAVPSLERLTLKLDLLEAVNESKLSVVVFPLSTLVGKACLVYRVSRAK